MSTNYFTLCSVMCLQFIPKTHMFFTGGKDGLIKQWDADNFEKITILKVAFLSLVFVQINFATQTSVCYLTGASQ